MPLVSHLYHMRPTSEVYAFVCSISAVAYAVYKAYAMHKHYALYKPYALYKHYALYKPNAVHKPTKILCAVQT